MDINSPDDLTPAAVEKLRTDLGMSAAQFWGAIDYSGQLGGFYEQGKRTFNKQARRLVFLHYVAGIPTNATADELRDLMALRNARARLTSAANQAADAAEAIRLAAMKIN